MKVGRRGLLFAAALASLAGCTRPQEPLRIGAQPFPGYELIFLARALGLLAERDARLIETPSASANLRALGVNMLEGAALTLDEVLGAREQGMALSVVCVLDVSHGADALLAQAGIDGAPGALRGRTVGVEQTATGAVMLDAALRAGGLSPADVKIVHMPIDEHERSFRAGRVDAIVTYEPVKSRLQASGARVLFDSTRIPGRIMDVLALRQSVLDPQAEQVRRLVQAHFAGRAAWLAEPARHAEQLARRLQLQPAQVGDAFAGLQLPDRRANLEVFADAAARLREQASSLGAVMMTAGLLQRPPALDGLFDGRFLAER